MSVVFVVDSEQQISCGGPWCARVAEVTSGPVVTFVLGEDRKTLVELARRRMSEVLSLPIDSVIVESVPAESEAVLRLARTLSCNTLVFVYHSEGKPW